MELTIDQIRQIACGVAQVQEADGKICLLRFTPEQTRLIRQRSENFYQKTFETASVSLEFETDSSTLRLSVEVKRGMSRNFFAHSIYVDDARIGELAGVFQDGEEKRTCCATFFFAPGTKRVRILFPWSSASRIIRLSLDDGAQVCPLERKKRILMFGDSITQGYDASVPERSYASRLARWLDVEAINKAIGGETFFPELAASADDLSPERIFVAYGTNDWSKSQKETFEGNSRAFLENLRRAYPDVEIVVLAPVWRADLHLQKPMGDISNVAKHYRKLAAELENITVIDCFDFIPHDRSFYRDGYLHPNDSGFDYYIRGLTNALNRRNGQ